MRLIRRGVLLLVAGSWAALAHGQTNASTELVGLSLQDLMQVPVTTVSRVAEPWFTAPSAVYVISAEDIRRSGATSLPEALRLAPGMNVASVNSHEWAVSARGLNSLFSRFLLVLVDGRPVYSPLFSGVQWPMVDTLLEDVDRIEVVRGPGATLWGANAVNGVINIITKSAWVTPGGLLTVGGGTEEQGFGALRLGGGMWASSFFTGFGARGSTVTRPVGAMGSRRRMIGGRYAAGSVPTGTRCRTIA
jgi:iron complex outermembrane receptor protein